MLSREAAMRGVEKPVTVLAAHRGDAKSVSLDVKGMTCDVCVDQVRTLLVGVAGVESATVDLATNSAQVAIRSDANVPTEELVKAFEGTKFSASAK
jgi:Cu+-exporting ATPase